MDLRFIALFLQILHLLEGLRGIWSYRLQARWLPGRLRQLIRLLDAPGLDQNAQYSQEWETDQLLQFCMHNFIFYFYLGLYGKIFDQNMPLLEGVNIK